MGSRTGQFTASMTKRFGKSGALKAERQVTALKRKFGTDSRAPFAITTASMEGKTRHPKRS